MSRERLFQLSFHMAWENALKKAVSEVGKLPRDAVDKPDLAGRLKKIEADNSLEVARINRDGVNATTKTVQREGTDGWGEHRRITYDVLEIAIPFTGDAESFKLSPSRCAIIYADCRIERDHLLLTVPDDDGAEGALQSFLKDVEGNLEALRTEYAEVKRQLPEALSNAVTHRRNVISTEDQRDKGRSFPVRR
jgi:hypothetical protein